IEHKSKILIVDDEELVLAGLRRGLRNYNNYCDFTFAQSGSEALNILDKDKFDVIISDMQMPQMDGAELLHKIRNSYPEMIRIILSGEASKSHIMRCVMLAHKYLAKPCRPDIIYQSIDKSLKFKSIIDQQYKGLISEITTLPSLPKIYKNVIDLLEKPGVSLTEVANVIEQDLAMSLKILQIINSAFFSLPRKINSLVDAISLLGLDVLMGLILHTSLFQAINQNLVIEFKLEKLTKHSFKIAKLCEDITKILNLSNEDTSDAYIAGMLHQIGTILFIHIAPEKYRSVMQEYNTNKQSLFEIEQKHLKQTHAELGAYLLALWGLPPAIVEAILYYPDNENLQDPSLLLTILYIAVQLETTDNIELIGQKLSKHPWINYHQLANKIPQIVGLKR
ncbi:MAG: HDOD domain-containing protein, partial [Romboutsia sp.]|nr:HDOD domain-containing protein [Romboutsia sp.]